MAIILKDRQNKIVNFRSPEKFLDTVQYHYKAHKSDRPFSFAEVVAATMADNFPTDIATKVRIQILTCYADLIRFGYTQIHDLEDRMAMMICYHTLSNSEAGQKARLYYQESLLCYAIEQSAGDLEHLRGGKRYEQLCEEWKEEVLSRFDSRFFCDLFKLPKIVRDDFVATIREAEKRGEFIQDKKEFAELLLKAIDDAQAV